MTLLLLLIGLLIALLGLAVVIAPAYMKKLLSVFLDRKWMWHATLFRLVIGALFFFGAKGTHYPLLLKTLGIILFVAGLLIPGMGFQRVESLAKWWMQRKDIWIRIWGVLAIALGWMVIWAVGI